MSFDWAAAEEAIATWIREATGYPPLWEYQANAYPETAAAMLDVVSLDPSDRAVADDPIDFDPAAPLNQEITLQTTQWFRLTVSVLILGTKPARLGAESTHALAARAATSLRQSSVQDALAAAGMGLIEVSRIMPGPELFKNVWRPATAFTVSFHIAETLTATAGYIAQGVVQSNFQPPPLGPMPFTVPEA